MERALLIVGMLFPGFLALFLMPIGVGYGILLGYRWNVVEDDEWEQHAE